MILVLLGTNPYPFTRLLEAMRVYAEKANTEIIAQTGNSAPVPGIECHAFMPHAELLGLIKKADVVIAQGGYGSLSDCLAAGARVVAVPRMAEFSECVDNQRELVEVFANEGLVVPVYDIEALPEAIEEARRMSATPADTSGLPGHIAKTIRSMQDGHQ